MMLAASAEAEAATTATTAMAISERSGSDCTDCSQCARRPRTGARSGVRVSVNLRQFFSDQRARAFMWAPYGRCVQWLCQRITRMFGLPDDIALMSRGHMLPVMEPLLILDPDDPIEVVKMPYVLAVHDKKDDLNVSSLRSTKESRAVIGLAGTNVRQIGSNIVMKKDNISQLPTSSQGDSLVEHENISRVALMDDMESELGSQNQTIDESRDLQRMKQSALRLLDERCHTLQEASAPKRLRRRRRRRKLQTAADEVNASDEENIQRSDVMASSPDVSDAILRNGSGSRSPRLVRPLSPPSILECVL